MKQSWIVGIMMLFLVFQLLANVAEMSATPIGASGGGFSSTTLGQMLTPTIDNTNIATSSWSFIQNAGEFLAGFGNMLGWNYPTLFPPDSGWMYVKYFLLCISAGFIITLVLIIFKGVGGS